MTTTPSQRAREAARALYYALSGGQEDIVTLTDAFAQFEAETLERAAEVADDAGAAFAGLREGVMFARIAKDIRKLIPTPPGERP